MHTTSYELDLISGTVKRKVAVHVPNSSKKTIDSRRGLINQLTMDIYFPVKAGTFASGVGINQSSINELTMDFVTRKNGNNCKWH